MKLFCNNKVAISIANNLVQYDRTEHVEVDRHFWKRDWIMVAFVFLTYPQGNKIFIFSQRGSLDKILILVLASWVFSILTSQFEGSVRNCGFVTHWKSKGSYVQSLPLSYNYLHKIIRNICIVIFLSLLRFRCKTCICSSSLLPMIIIIYFCLDLT